MIDLTLIGYIGGILLAICGAPQAYLSYKQGHSDGISILFLLLWSFGEIFTLIYIIPKIDIPLLLNYTSNLFFLLIIWKYKIFRRNK
jgi:uncharacterized protein with PQ loop repeat